VISSEEFLEQHQARFTIQGRTWNVLDAGLGEPMIFLHNGGGSLWNWAYQIQYFASKYRVIAPDLPGSGLSYRSTEPLTLEAFLRGVLELLETLNCSKSILIGNCIGASIALELALRHPEKVEALVLFNLCGGMPMLNPWLRFVAALRPRTAMGQILHRRMIDITGHPSLQHLSTRWVCADEEPRLHPMQSQFIQQQQMDSRLWASIYWLVMGLNSFDLFSGSRQKPSSFPPVLLGWGKQNRTLHPNWAMVVAEWLKPDDLWMIESAGHLPMVEQPQRVNEKLDSFLEARSE
jgi:3-oxoadipate enol-lactonase